MQKSVYANDIFEYILCKCLFSFIIVAVRYGRVPKRSKSLDDQRIGVADSSQDQTSIESKQLEIYDTILNVSQAHLANCALTEDKLKMQQRKSVSLVSQYHLS